MKWEFTSPLKCSNKVALFCSSKRSLLGDLSLMVENRKTGWDPVRQTGLVMLL